MRGVVKTALGALWISWKCVFSLGLVYEEEAFFTICIPQEALIDFY